MAHAAAAVVAVRAARRRQAERALNELLMDPGPFLLRETVEMMRPVWLLLVYVHSVELVPKLANTRLQLRARYGGSGRYQEKYSPKVKSTASPAVAMFESMFVFPWSTDLQSVLALDLVKLGFVDWTQSTAGIQIPFGPGNPGATECDMLFFGKKGEDGFVGQIKLFLEVKSISRAELELGIEGMGFNAMDPRWTAPSLTPGLVVLDPSMIATAGDSGQPVPVQGRVVRGGVASGTAVQSGVVQGSAVQGDVVTGRPVASSQPVASPQRVSQDGRTTGNVTEEVYQDASGQTRHVIVTRHPDGSEERLEFVE